MIVVTPPSLAPFLKVSYLFIRNSTMALKHKAAFQALLDDLIKHCCHTLVKTLCPTEKTIHSNFHCVVYLLYKISHHIGFRVCLKSKVGQ